jgi:hypothetical protein
MIAISQLRKEFRSIKIELTIENKHELSNLLARLSLAPIDVNAFCTTAYKADRSDTPLHSTLEDIWRKL